MTKKEKDAATLEVAALTKVLDQALEAQKSLAEDVTEEVKAEAKKNVDDAQAVLDAKNAEIESANKPSEKEKQVKVKFLLSPVGKFSLAYVVGETGTFNSSQATELVEAKYAEFVK